MAKTTIVARDEAAGGSLVGRTADSAAVPGFGAQRSGSPLAGSGAIERRASFVRATGRRIVDVEATERRMAELREVQEGLAEMSENRYSVASDRRAAARLLADLGVEVGDGR